MSALQSLETSLEDLFVKKAPPLPPGGKKALVKYLPWINLALGVLSLYAAWLLWHWAHYTNNLIDYANTLSATYGAPAVAVHRLTFGVWLSVIALTIQAALYIAAFPASRDRKRSGWNFMFYALLVNIAYGVLVLFTDYGSIGNLISTIIGSGIGLYLLFQIRASYLKTPAKVASTKK